VKPIDWLTPGPIGAQETLTNFLKNTLIHYNDRNDPNKEALSLLSPYLHYGNISAQRIVIELMKKTGKRWEELLSKSEENPDPAAGFFEELVVRRELADNFCHYNPHYDSPLGYPEWARKSHEKHAQDPREYIYTYEQFRDAQTHDDLWNAAQKEMKKTGKMHGYMRMYWCKKILEWTKDVTTAHEIAIQLNDTYEIDGRDPNGYAGIAWSLG
jgi:deoxyribodipyrimidine photo-lyase